MDSKKQIEFIKEAWGKFLEKKKNENQDLDIKKLESIEEVKKAFLIRDAVAEVAEVDDIDVTEEQVTTLANILIEKEIISQRKPKLKAERMTFFWYSGSLGFPKGRPIGKFSQSALGGLIAWICSFTNPTSTVENP